MISIMDAIIYTFCSTYLALPLGELARRKACLRGKYPLRPFGAPLPKGEARGVYHSPKSIFH